MIACYFLDSSLQVKDEIKAQVMGFHEQLIEVGQGQRTEKNLRVYFYISDERPSVPARS